MPTPHPSPPLDALLALGHRRAADAGEVLLSEGEEADRIVVLLSGRVKVSASTVRGPTAVLGFRGPGAVLGELGALSGEPRMATVTAIEPVEVVVVAASSFRHHLLTHPVLAVELIAQLGRRLLVSDRRCAEHLTSDTTARVAGRLVELAEQYGVQAPEGRRIALPLSQEELAGLAGSSLESVSKALRTLRTAGWIETGRREITLRDVEALRRRAVG